jgi:hypothetical protein
MLILILLAFAFVCFIFYGAGVPSSPPERRWNFLGYGLALCVAAEILGRAFPNLARI